MAKKQLSDWAAIAEIIGAVAIVFSLLYVGFEIQRNTKVGLASNRQEIAARAQELALYSAETGIYRLLFSHSLGRKRKFLRDSKSPTLKPIQNGRFPANSGS